MVNKSSNTSIQSVPEPVVSNKEMIDLHTKAQAAAQNPPSSNMFSGARDVYGGSVNKSSLAALNTGNASPTTFSPQSNPEGYIKPAEGPITSGVGHRDSPGGVGSTDHKGIDIGAPENSPIWAAKDGTVTFSGEQQGYGNIIEIKHADGNTTKYAHANSLMVKEGQQVKQGQQIGTVGSTGNVTGPHLHFELLDSQKNVLNPASIMTA